MHSLENRILETKEFELDLDVAKQNYEVAEWGTADEVILCCQ